MNNIIKLSSFLSSWVHNGLLTVIILPFIVLCLFLYPHSDDYWSVIFLKKYGFWQSQVEWYYAWFGRYTMVFIMNIHAVLFTNGYEWMYKIYPLIAINGIIGSIYFLLRTLYRELLPTIKYWQWSLWLLFIFLYKAPKISESLYWMVAVVNYTYAFPCILLFFSLLFRYFFEEHYKNYKIFLLLCFLIIFIIGLSEVSMFIFILLFCSFIFLFIIHNKKIPPVQIIMMIMLVLCCSLVVIKAPGNSIRTSMYIRNSLPTHDLLFSVKSSIKLAVSYVFFEWFRDSVLPWVSLLFVAFNHEYVKKLKDHPIFRSHPLILAFISWSIIVAAFFPGYWSMGGPLPERAINLIYLLFLVLYFFNLQNFLIFLNKHHLLTVFSSSKLISSIAMIMILLLMTRENGIKTAVMDLISGDAKIYESEMQIRITELRACKSDTCVVLPLSRYPKSLVVQELNKNPNSWPNDVYEQKFDKKAIILSNINELNK